MLRSVRALLQTLPPTTAAFAYGSAVFPNAGAPGMLDLVLVVPDARAFHAAALAAHPGHYALLPRLLGPAATAAVQRAGPGVHFNVGAALPDTGAPCKYAVVEERALLRDLRTWDALYMAGRLHKTVAPVVGADWLHEHNRGNLAAALDAALCLLPDRFSGDDLLAVLVGLSYGGDIRMGVAEHPDKVRNIASRHRDALGAWYAPAIAAAEARGVLQRSTATATATGNSGTDWYEADPARVPVLLAGLPSAVCGASSPDQLRAAMAAIVRRSSAIQAAKGLYSTGVLTAVRYVGRKVGKALRLV